MGLSPAGGEPQQSIVEEHRYLADRIDNASKQIDIFFSVTANKTQSSVTQIIVLLDELLEIARSHFQHEEALMVKNAFPGLIFHKRDHDYLIKSLVDFTSSLSHGTVPFSPDIGVNLQSWLTYHIKKYDDVYPEFIEAARPDAGD